MRRILVIDPQVAFCEPQGSLARSFGGDELREIKSCLARLEQFLCAYPQPEEVFLIRSEYRPGQFTAGDLAHPFAGACVPGSADCDWSLTPAALAGKRVFTKHVESAVTVPELLEALNGDGKLDEVMLAGFLTTSCVRRTALDLRTVLPVNIKIEVLGQLTASRASNYVALDGQLSPHAAALAVMAQAQCYEAQLHEPRVTNPHSRNV